MSHRELTPQMLFDIVAEHLLTQGERSMLKSWCGAASCAYRGENGLRCAVGVLILDDEYSVAMEGKGVSDDDGCQSILPDRLKKHAKLLRQLQGVHDDHDPRDWSRELSHVAGRFHLNDAMARVLVSA